MIELPGGMTLERLKERFDYATQVYSKALKKAYILDASDKSQMWEAINAKYPSYQILPYTNHVARIKCNILASVYTVGKNATVLPTSTEDKDIIENINLYLDYFWNACSVGFYQMQAGDRAALLNLGITQVGWDNNMVGGRGETFIKGVPAYRNIDPLTFMRDPSAKDFEHANYCMVWEDYHKVALQDSELYSEGFNNYVAKKKIDNATNSTVPTGATDKDQALAKQQKDYYTIITHWYKYKEEGKTKICEVHVINHDCILYKKDEIKPNMFPFALLYSNLPGKDLIGTSEPAKIFANSLAVNMMNSIITTSEYKNQHPPKFIDGRSNLNVAAFSKHGDDAGKTFVVAGDASRAVHYHTFPTPSPAAFSICNSLNQDVGEVTGIDGRYTGRDTGSILTTGGIQDMLNQVTMIDAPRIVLYEQYVKRLTELTLANLLEYSGARKYIVKNPDPNFTTVKSKYILKEVDFPKVPADALFNYEVSINNTLPKNKQRIADKATEIYEKQLQYQSAGQQVDWITPEEWLRYQDIPMKEEMFERMGLQRYSDTVEDISEAVIGFSELAKSGVDPVDAISIVSQNLVNKKTPGRQTYGELQPAQENSLPVDLMS